MRDMTSDCEPDGVAVHVEEESLPPISFRTSMPSFAQFCQCAVERSLRRHDLDRDLEAIGSAPKRGKGKRSRCRMLLSVRVMNSFCSEPPIISPSMCGCSMPGGGRVMIYCPRPCGPGRVPRVPCGAPS